MSLLANCLAEKMDGGWDRMSCRVGDFPRKAKGKIKMIACIKASFTYYPKTQFFAVQLEALLLDWFGLGQEINKSRRPMLV